MARVLIIEDEAAILNLLKRIVSYMDHEAHIAPSGPDALTFLAGHEVDLIISDLRMPGAPSGVELIRELRNRFPRLPIIVISGYVSRDFMAKWPELGVDEFLPKPFNMDAIRTTIDRALARAAETPA